MACFRQAADLYSQSNQLVAPLFAHHHRPRRVLGMTIASLTNLYDEWISSTTQGGVTMIDDKMPWDDLWTDLGGEG
ncbi:MAG TPA: hypothetical protein VFE62_20845 [Gemmataceae bacterium]|nr:hypothetical protein [Gemmataceae bacterium]